MTDLLQQEWLTASEIAALRLAGMPATKRGVQKHAERHGWRASTRARRRAGRGGGWEYHISLLPDAALADLLARRAEHPLVQNIAQQLAHWRGDAEELLRAAQSLINLAIMFRRVRP